MAADSRPEVTGEETLKDDKSQELRHFQEYSFVGSSVNSLPAQQTGTQMTGCLVITIESRMRVYWISGFRPMIWSE